MFTYRQVPETYGQRAAYRLRHRGMVFAYLYERQDGTYTATLDNDDERKAINWALRGVRDLDTALARVKREHLIDQGEIEEHGYVNRSEHEEYAETLWEQEQGDGHPHAQHFEANEGRYL